MSIGFFFAGGKAQAVDVGHANELAL